MNEELKEQLNELEKVVGVGDEGKPAQDGDLNVLVKSIANLKGRLNTSEKLIDTLGELSFQNKEFGKALKELYELVKDNAVKLPEKFDVEVANPVEEVKVSNLSDIKIPEPKGEVKISNLGDISDYKKDLLSLAQLMASVNKILSEKDITVNLDRYMDSKRPLSVRLSDGKKFYDAIMQGISQIGTGSLTATIDTTGLATEAKQDDIITAIGNISLTTTDEAMAWDNTTTANVTYVGYAVLGTETSDALWKVKKVDTANGLTTWADGDADYDNKWDDRASLSYD